MCSRHEAHQMKYENFLTQSRILFWIFLSLLSTFEKTTIHNDKNGNSVRKMTSVKHYGAFMMMMMMVPLTRGRQSERERTVSVWHLAFDPFDKCNIFIYIYMLHFSTHPFIHPFNLSIHLCSIDILILCTTFKIYTTYLYTTVYHLVCMQWDSKTSIAHTHTHTHSWLLMPFSFISSNEDYPCNNFIMSFQLNFSHQK